MKINNKFILLFRVFLFHFLFLALLLISARLVGWVTVDFICGLSNFLNFWIWLPETRPRPVYRQAPLGVSVEPTYTVPGRHCVEIDRFCMASLSKIKYFGFVHHCHHLIWPKGQFYLQWKTLKKWVQKQFSDRFYAGKIGEILRLISSWQVFYTIRSMIPRTFAISDAWFSK